MITEVAQHMTTSRDEILAQMLPHGVPPLWCPPLTHYTDEGHIDHSRIKAQLRFMAPWVKGLLVPGTTGDGWELTPRESGEVVDVMLENVSALGMRLLWGALHPQADMARRMIESGVALLKQLAGSERTFARIAHLRRVWIRGLPSARGGCVTGRDAGSAIADPGT